MCLLLCKLNLHSSYSNNFAINSKGVNQIPKCRYLHTFYVPPSLYYYSELEQFGCLTASTVVSGKLSIGFDANYIRSCLPKLEVIYKFIRGFDFYYIYYLAHFVINA